MGSGSRGGSRRVSRRAQRRRLGWGVVVTCAVVGVVVAGLVGAIRHFAAGQRVVEAPVPSVSPLPVALPVRSGSPDTEVTASLPDDAWVEFAASATGVSARAVRAYAGAALFMAKDNPECAIPWTLLAGVGRVESFHGQINGSEVRADGLVTPQVIGIALDGNGVAAIRDSDGGALDGDVVWDRAVGPMQFIPQTWEQFGVDATGSGSADPHHIDDAALTAARYLCDRAGGPVVEEDRWRQAILAYNNSVQYVRDVTTFANRYALAVGQATTLDQG